MARPVDGARPVDQDANGNHVVQRCLEVGNFVPRLFWSSTVFVWSFLEDAVLSCTQLWGRYQEAGCSVGDVC